MDIIKRLLLVCFCIGIFGQMIKFTNSLHMELPFGVETNFELADIETHEDADEGNDHSEQQEREDLFVSTPKFNFKKILIKELYLHHLIVSSRNLNVTLFRPPIHLL